MTGANPTIRRRQLATRLRELRQEAGFSIEEVAKELLCSTAKISRMETAGRGAGLRDVRDLANLYLPEDEKAKEALLAMAREAQQSGWWEAYDDKNFRKFIGLEEAAAAITVYVGSIVPGLFQTEEYATALIRGMYPHMQPDVLTGRVATRLKRQELLVRESPPRYITLLDEAVLHRHVGSPTIMQNQLQQIIELSRLDNVAVHVLPYYVGAHMGLDNTFTFLEIPDLDIPNTVLLESLSGLLYLEKPSEIQIYEEAIASLTADALGPADSVAHIAEVAKGLGASARWL